MTKNDPHADATVAYWNSIRARACAACLDVADNGACGLRSRLCALAAQLPVIVRAIASVQSDRMDEYVQAIEEQVCRRCHEQDTAGNCRLRDRGECALYTYLPLVVDAIDEVKAAGASTAGRG
jgi:hypothetical protein